MTAATVEHRSSTTPTPDDVLGLGLEQPGALTLASLPTEQRRAMAARAVADRRTALALYVDLYAERYGHRLDLHVVEDADALLGELILLAIA